MAGALPVSYRVVVQAGEKPESEELQLTLATKTSSKHGSDDWKERDAAAEEVKRETRRLAHNKEAGKTKHLIEKMEKDKFEIKHASALVQSKANVDELINIRSLIGLN